MTMKLDQHLKQLPNHSVEVELWDSIDQQLSTPCPLADKLPQHKADSLLWFTIEDQLGTPSNRRFLPLRYISAAASIAVIMTIGTIFLTNSNKGDIYFTEKVYIQEVMDDDNAFEAVDVLENCNEYPAVCSTPDFTRLKTNLDQLKREELKLRDLKKATNDPKMELYHSRIVKNIQQVEAQMIQMFS